MTMQYKTALVAGVATIALSSASLAQEPVQIDFWHAMGGALGETVDAIATEYNASQEQCQLTPIFKGTYEETMTAGIAAFRAEEAPEIIQIFDAGAATIINAPGVALPVQDLLEEQGVAFDINDYVPGVRYFYADSDGKMIGMPFNSSTPVLYYNQAALEEAGVEPPKTWEEFDTVTAPALKEAGYIGLAQSHLPWIFSENFHSRHNLQMATNNNGYDGLEGTEILYNNEHMANHYQKLVDWRDNGFFEFYGTAWGDNQTPFEQGDVAMWLGSSGSFGGLKQVIDWELGTTFLPYWEGVNPEPTGTFIGGAALFAISGHEPEEYACVANFFEYLTKPETQYFWHRETGYVPITTAAYKLAQKEGYYEEEPGAEVGIQQLSLPSGDWSKGYRLGFYVQIREIMNQEFEKMFAGEVTPEEALATIEEEGNALLERFAKTMNQ